MLEAVFWFLIGAFIGWNIPQPLWAQSLQSKIKNLFKRNDVSD
jgi:hypothetical protein